MSPIFPYIPPAPISAEPPARLVTIVDTIKLPPGYQIGLTTIQGGKWALLVKVPPRTHTPIPEIVALAPDEPIVYQTLPERATVARPADPALGE
jgi:hypothetical protein